jgi:hypothetical protein
LRKPLPKRSSSRMAYIVRGGRCRTAAKHAFRFDMRDHAEHCMIMPSVEVFHVGEHRKQKGSGHRSLNRNVTFGLPTRAAIVKPLR